MKQPARNKILQCECANSLQVPSGPSCRLHCCGEPSQDQLMPDRRGGRALRREWQAVFQKLRQRREEHRAFLFTFDRRAGYHGSNRYPTWRRMLTWRLRSQIYVSVINIAQTRLPCGPNLTDAVSQCTKCWSRFAEQRFSKIAVEKFYRSVGDLGMRSARGARYAG
jgi:hypothetical protein